MFQKSLKQIYSLSFSIVLLLPLSASADHQIYFKKLHNKKAWLHINGRHGALGKGQIRDGVKVLSISRNQIIVKVHDKRYRYELGSKTGIELEDEVKIPFNRNFSAYIARGSINGKDYSFIVDTGAETVGLNLNDARRLNIKLRRRDEIIVVLAGGKTTKGWRTKLKSVKIGDIELNDIEAIIIKQSGQTMPLLGMSFLRKLSISQANNVLTLKYENP